ncbi:MAG: sigma-70 family RNA polymerase sigma factor [Solirubrobacterales bacterium]|nr:sigma-70 family RNA polymerase sigma factor [Solirubrobacterales bacterium]
MDLSKPTNFEAVYAQHSRSVYAAAYRILNNAAQAQDVTQDVFMKIWRNPARFDSQRGELGSYLRLMGRSRALDLWREGQAAGRAGARLQTIAASEEGRVEDRPEAAALRSDAREHVRKAMRELPTPQREAIVLAYWGGMTADEVARQSDVPLGTVKSRIRLGLAKLREQCGPLVDIAA